MPYKSYRGKRKYYRKRKYAGWRMKAAKAGTAIGLASKALSVASKVARLVNAEYKFTTSTLSATSTYGGTITNLTTIAQGATEQTRNGTSIKLLNFKLRGTLQPNPSGSLVQTFRIILFRGKTENGSSFSTSDILQNTGSAFVTESFKNWDEMTRTKILFDKKYTITFDGDGSSTVRDIRINKKLFGHVKYSSGSSTVESGGLYLLILGDAAVNGANYAMTYRLTFTDN